MNTATDPNERNFTFWTTSLGEREGFYNLQMLLTDNQALELITALSGALHDENCKNNGKSRFMVSLFGRLEPQHPDPRQVSHLIHFVKP